MILDCKKLFIGEEKSLPINYEVDLSELEVDSVRPFVSPVCVKGTATGREGFANLDLSVSFNFSIPCDRCTRQTEKRYAYSFSHVLVPKLENEEDDRFVETKENRLDLDGLVREDILLELPTKFLCREDCKGICPNCGKNLNDGPCACGEGETDPRFDALKNLIH